MIMYNIKYNIMFHSKQSFRYFYSKRFLLKRYAHRFNNKNNTYIFLHFLERVRFIKYFIILYHNLLCLF